MAKKQPRLQACTFHSNLGRAVGGETRKAASEVIRFTANGRDYIEIRATDRGGISVRGSRRLVLRPNVSNDVDVELGE